MSTTTHSGPNEPHSRATWSSRWKFVALVMLFVGPVMLAVGLYFMADVFQPATDSHGDLVEPAQPLEPFSARTITGADYDLAALRGHWTLVHVIDADCGAECRERIHYTRQVRDALGHERIRVRRLALVPADGAGLELAALLPEHPDLTVIHSGGGLETQLPENRADGTVFLVDPLGNLMMRFDANVEPAGILDDLKQLLRVSRIG
jgi:hypothetical protein